MTSELGTAFSIRSPEDCLRVYRDWAASYDSGFARDMDYLLPAHVAGAFLAAGGGGPVLDVGAGTGLLAEALRAQGFGAEIDAIDLSAEMLDRAAAKGIYRALRTGDITAPLPLSGYRGIVSSGTFTRGHVGPEALPHLLEVAEAGAQFALSINAAVYAERGFDRALAALGGAITAPQLLEVEIYGAGARRLDPDHAGDRALVALFRKV
jgi:SAM-dependent methyltransferase